MVLGPRIVLRQELVLLELLPKPLESPVLCTKQVSMVPCVSSDNPRGGGREEY